MEEKNIHPSEDQVLQQNELPELESTPAEAPEAAPVTEAAPPAEPETEPRAEELPEALPEETPEAAEEPEADEDLAQLLAETSEEPVDLPVLPDPEEEALDQEYRDNGKDFDEMLAAPAKKHQSPARRRPTRKGRPKRRGGDGLLGIPHILVTFVWIGLILAIGVTAGRMLWVCAADVLAFGREDRPVTITIYEADTMDQITDKLYNAGLIKYKSLFSLYADISDAEEDIRPGIYDLNTRYDYHALVNFMTPKSSREVVTLTIPEGYTCAQIFDLLEENRICTAIDAAAYAANGELNDYWFLEGVERGTENCLEGYLFPDTYEFYKNSTPREALQRMLNNFDNRFDEEMRLQIDTLNQHISEMMRKDGRGEDYIASHQFTLADVVIVASLIEKETAGDSESPTIASVIYNRLFNWGSTPAFLNIDASIIYALGGKTDLTSEDMRVDSPYNTYLYTGLTPTAISNPGLASLKAALNPAESPYYYYVLNPATGKHQFSKTQEEHNDWVNQFREG